MKIHQASRIIEDKLEKSVNKSEKKTYHKLLGVLTHLKGRDLSEEQVRSIEEKIDELKLFTYGESTPKETKRSSAEFTKFVSDYLSLISEGHFTALGVSLGVAFGAAIHSVSGHSLDLGTGIGIGIAIGAAIGIFMDREAERKNQVLVSRLEA